MEDDRKQSSETEIAIDLASFVSSAVPWIGGPISNVLSGVSFGRKISRVREVLEGVAGELNNFKSEVSEKYVKTDEFEELLEKTLRKVAEERNEQKRVILRKFIIEAIKTPGEPYDEQIRFLRTLEEIQPDHLRVLQALNQGPDLDTGRTGFISGAPLQTLLKRLPEINEKRIEDLIMQLNDMRVTNLTSLKTMMTWSGAQNLVHSITPYEGNF